MNCVELQQSLAEIDDGSNAEQRAHLKTCRTCAALVADLNLIAASAVELRDAHEPSPRVWNSIEIALRQEGLIRPQTAGRSLLPSLSSRWGWSRWLLPVAAALLIALGLYLRPYGKFEQGAKNVTEPSAPEIATAGLSDDDLLQEISEQSPALRKQYADNLKTVNEYIHDAKGSVDADPNDEDARRSLMDAYQEKAMLFELAMDRSQQ
jgi:hypothetical protein